MVLFLVFLHKDNNKDADNPEQITTFALWAIKSDSVNKK
jgi:hypothetical protein